jgi:hypothetical protein
MIMHIYVGTYYSTAIPMDLDFLGGTTVISLYAELKQYRDIICASCREKVLLAATRSPQQSALSSSRDTVDTLGSLSGHTDIIAAHSDAELPIRPFTTEDEPSSPVASSWGDYESDSSVEGSQTHSDNSFHSASQSFPNSPNITPDFPLSPTFPAPVEYNPEIKQTLDLSVVSTFAVPAGVQCVAFSRDGRYFAVGLRNEETHVFDMTNMTTMSKK